MTTDSKQSDIDYNEGNSVLHPCGHMRYLISSLADGSLRGIPAWYARLHIKGCTKCSLTAVELTKLRNGLRNISGEPDPVLTPVQREVLDTTLNKIDTSAS